MPLRAPEEWRGCLGTIGNGGSLEHKRPRWTVLRRHFQSKRGARRKRRANRPRRGVGRFTVCTCVFVLAAGGLGSTGTATQSLFQRRGGGRRRRNLQRERPRRAPPEAQHRPAGVAAPLGIAAPPVSSAVQNAQGHHATSIFTLTI